MSDDVNSPSPDDSIGFNSRWGHSQADSGNGSVSAVRQNALRSFRFELEFCNGDELGLRALSGDAPAARLSLLSSRWGSYLSVALTSAECESLAAALEQCAREKRAAAQDARVST